MKFAIPCLVFVVAVSGAVGLAAQERPNFSGTWSAVGPQQALRELTIKHDGSTLSFEGKPPDMVTMRTLKLDGSETEIAAPDGKPLRAKAIWEGTTLVVTIHSPELKQDIRRQTWMIDADGQLVMETQFLGGKPQAPRKEIFKRR